MIESTFDDTARTATLTSGQVIHGFHKSTWCKGEHCPVHKPSDHRYRHYRLWFNFEKFVFEREVTEKANTEFPFIIDPDDYTLNLNQGKMIYRNSIRCNHCKDEIESSYRHDFKSCNCGKVAVDGGNAYQRRVGSPEDYTDTSICFENGEFIKMEDRA